MIYKLNNIKLKSTSKRKLIITGAIFFVLIITIILVWQTRQHFLAIKLALITKPTRSTNSLSNPLNQKPIVLVESALNGEKVDEGVVNRRPLAVVVENHPEARSQRGLSDASVVYEAISEGGITRFLAIFGPKSAVKVGPVRSARTYFNSWVLEYDALYGHVGGNSAALKEIPQLGIKDLDQFGIGTRAYQREPKAGVATEHTMFTSTDKLWEVAKSFKKYDIATNSTPTLLWKEDEVSDKRPQGQTVTIDFSTASYQVIWNYDHDSNSYRRVLAGQPHIDLNNNKQLSTKTIVIQEVNREPIVTEANENSFRFFLIGKGPAKIVQDGTVIEGQWQKPDQKSRTRFYIQDGNELQLNRGTMWLEVVPPGTPVSITNEMNASI